MKRRKKELLYTLGISMVLLVALLCLFPLKFAKFLYNGNIDGTAVVPAQNAIRITKTIFLSNYNANTSASKVNDFHQTTMESTMVLGSDLASNITYRITVKNYDLAATKYTGFNVTNDNEDIEITVSGINNGESIASGATKEFNVTFKYKSTLTNITNNTSNSTIVFNFDNSNYSYEEPSIVLDGSNYLNTNIQLFSNDNASKDFEVSFVLDSLPANQTERAVLFGNTDESGEPYFGVCVRYNNGNITLVANVDSEHKKEEAINLQVGNKFILRRINGILSYSVDGGQHYTNYADFTGFSNYFYSPATFGAGLDNTLNPFRYYKGTLTNASIKVIEPSYYTVKFISNGGTGTMAYQKFSVNLADHIRPLGFTRDGYIFSHWNTQYNGSGNKYNDGDLIKGLGQANQTVMLFAQWKSYPHYTVRFDNNGGEGEMSDQDFVYGTAKNLTTSTLTKTGLQFMNWNTKADGTGTTYKDGEEVINLTEEENGVVTLYAMYGLDKYEYANQINFDGSVSINTYNTLFDSTHIHRDFELSFDIVNVGNNADLNTILNSMQEVTPYQGFVFRVYNNNSFELNGNFGDLHVSQLYDITISKFIMRSVQEELYVSTDGVNFQHLGNISGITENNIPIVLGSSIDNTNNPWRYFTGSIKNLAIYYY